MTNNIIEIWEKNAVAKHGDLKIAVQALNDAIGSSYKMNRYYEFRQGSRPLPQAVYEYMLKESLIDILVEQKLYNEAFKNKLPVFIKSILPPKRLN